MKFEDFIELHRGYDLPKKQRKNGQVPVIASTGINGTHNVAKIKGPGVVTGRSGSIGKVQYIKDDFWPLNTTLYVSDFKGNNPKFVAYWLERFNLKRFSSGSAVPTLNRNELANVEICVPNREEQDKIVAILEPFEKKIELNQEINDNLLELAKTLFSEEFSSNEEVLLSNYLLPKRGKNLLKKNVVSGEFPVIAGGLKPAAFHNSYNTKAPVITISASGANAGYVQIWGQPVWSSDSSYIDTSITKDIYFWYLLLKKYQKQIFDAQTGSAQPHIYPKHIGNLLIPNISEDSIKNFNITITPIFKKIFQNKNENNKLKAIKNSLLIKYFN